MMDKAHSPLCVQKYISIQLKMIWSFISLSDKAAQQGETKNKEKVIGSLMCPFQSHLFDSSLSVNLKNRAQMKYIKIRFWFKQKQRF